VRYTDRCGRLVPVRPGWRRTLAALGALAALAAGGAASAQGGAVPAGLRSTFMFGLAANPTDGQVGPTFGNITWMQNSGTRWDACYQYLAGGVNTGSGWATWNSGGYFATKYLQEADAAGYIPVFTYYQLLQSNPHSGGDESAQDFSNLNNPSTMAAYYADFKLLMQKCGAFGKTAIVHVEPDMWAYLQNDHAGGTDDAAHVSAAVASSGFPEAAGLPNTAAGYARCLVKLRDTYAPNVLLAPHASGWATAVDLGSDTRSSIDVAAHARRVANFLNSLGAGWDLFFYDPLDRDAAFYEFVYGDGGARWWNESDSPTTYPNFVRIRQWLAYLSQYQNKRCVLWQVPVGNYYYSACNNTDGHYEDNRAQYFLEGYPTNPHIQQWADAGVIGLLFGRGAGGPTTYSDAKGDGVTNPAPYVKSGTRRSPSNLGHVSANSDDDGGYLRLKVRAYFAAGAYSLTDVPSPPAGPPAISSVSAAATSPNSATVSWTTDQPADSRVEYGPTTAYGSTSSGAASVTAHTVSLSSLTPGTTYHYRVRSRNAAGQESVSADATFATPRPADFSLAVSPTTLTLLRGRAGSFTVSLAGLNGFASSVSLSAVASPSLTGTLSFSTTSLSPNGAVILSVRVGRRALPGAYTVTVTGVGGGLTHWTTATVVVQ
jgi:purple acid phosphatase-like protein